MAVIDPASTGEEILVIHPSTASGIDNLDAVHAYFSALENHDLDRVRPYLSPRAIEAIASFADGANAPFPVFDGPSDVLGYLGIIVANFEEIQMAERSVFVADGAATIFAEVAGHLMIARTGTSYRNVYLFKFSFDENLITHITEYANPSVWL